MRLPTRYLLPQVAPAGLVVNIPEMRLYDFGVKDGPEVLAVAIGDAVDATPVGEFRVGKEAHRSGVARAEVDPRGEARAPAGGRRPAPTIRSAAAG